jgi:fructose transport system permease protein
MAENEAPTKTISDFEATLTAADTAVASFAEDDKSFGHVARSILRNYPTAIPALVLIISVIVFGIIDVYLNGERANFMTPNTLSVVLKQVTVVGIVAVAQTIVILTAGIDLSVAAILVLSSVIMGKLSVDVGLPPELAILIGLAFGALMGGINGLLVTMAKLPPFIVTLGTLSIYTALKLWYSGSQSVRGADVKEQAPLLLWFGEAFNFGGATLTYGGIAMILLAFVVWYILTKTSWGRHVHAIGDDPDAAMLAGIQTNRVLIGVYTFAGAICAFGGWVAIGRVGGTISPIAFETANLDSITAVVIGGTSLFGGRGSIPGSVLGALIVGVFSTGLSVAARVDDYWQTFAAGCLVLVAVALDQWLRRASK